MWGVPVDIVSDALAFAPGSAPSVALLAVLPALLIIYVRYRIATRRLRPGLSLRQFEAVELYRTVLLYTKASRRIKDIHRECRLDGPARRAQDPGLDHGRRQLGEELEDLESYAGELRSRIVRLRGLPFKRYKDWAHLVSARSAIGRSSVCYASILLLLLATLCYFEPILWASGIGAGFKTFVLWQAVKERMLLGNWMAVNLVVVAVPLLYVVRRANLYRAHRLQILELKAFAIADPDQLIDDRPDDQTTIEALPDALAEEADSEWFSCTNGTSRCRNSSKSVSGFSV